MSQLASKQASTVFRVVTTSNDQLQLMLQHSAVYAHTKTINLAAETRKITATHTKNSGVYKQVRENLSIA